MSMDMWILWFTFAPAVLFTVTYAVGSRWWVYAEGQNVLLLGLLLSLLSGRALLLRYDARPDPASPWETRAIVAGIAVVLWWRLGLLLLHQARARRDRNVRPHEES